VDIQDLAVQTVAVAAHHIGEPRPEGPPGYFPDDATRPYALAELRRLAHWSLDQNPTLRDKLTARPQDEDLRQQAVDGFAGDLTRYPHLVPPVAAFVGRVLAPVPAPVRAGAWRWVLVAALTAIAIVVGGGVTAAALSLVKAGVAAGATASGPAPRLHTTIEFGSIDLDQQPPGSGVGRDVVAEFGPALMVASNAVGAPYAGSTPATKQSCQDDLAENGVGATAMGESMVIASDVKPGMAFCVGTTAGDTAFLKITATTDSTFTADVMIWGP
jgi:hypothetical protein